MTKDEIERLKEAHQLQKDIRRSGGVAQYKREIEEMRKVAFSLQRPSAEQHLIDLTKVRDAFNLKFQVPEELAQFNKNLNDNFKVTNAFLKDFDKSLKKQLEEIHYIFAAFNRVREELILVGREWGRTVEALDSFKVQLRQQVLESSLTWRMFTDTVAQRIRDLRLLETHPLLSARLIQPGVIYSHYSTDLTERIERSSNEDESKALSGSLILAQEQLENSIVLSPGVVVIPEDEDDQLLVEPVYNIFAEQERELIAVCSVLPAEKSYEILSNYSIASKIAEKARHCIELVIYCNKANNVNGNEDIFKPTTKFTESCSLLPFTIAKDQSTLQVVVEHLYFILYEGAGKDNLRFITEGFIKIDEMLAVMQVKFLRNKWLSHDPDHGSEGKIKKTWRDLGDTLSQLGINKLPQTDEEFTELQMRLLNSVEQFLELLAGRISNSS